MDTALLTGRAAGGDLDSFGQLYDAYFGRVYDFTWRLLRDAEAAGEITREVFGAASQSLPGIVAYGDFGDWVLLAAARSALARSEQAAAGAPRVLHEEAFGSFDVPDPCRLSDPKLTGGDHALACEVWEAATTLGARDYAALDLHLRQHLDPPVLAPLLGVSKGNAAPLLRRLESAADEAMLTYVLARRGGAACEPLRRVIAETGFPRYDEDARHAIDAHAATCVTCTAKRPLPSAPTAILAGLVPVQAPYVLKGDMWRALVGGWPAAAAAGIDARAREVLGRPPGPQASPALADFSAASALTLDRGFGGGYDGGGFDGRDAAAGRSGDDARRNVVWFIAAAVGMIAVAFLIGGIAVGAFGIGGGGSGGGGAAAATRTRTPAAAGTPAETPSAGVHIDTPTAAPSVSASPEATTTDTPVPDRTSTPPPAPTRPPPPPPATPTPVVVVPPTPVVPPTSTLPRQLTPTPRPGAPAP